MAQVITDAGAIAILDAYFKQTATLPAEFVCRLYSDDATPSHSDSVSDRTTCTVGGYADVTLSLAAASLSIVASIAQVEWPQAGFTFTSGFGGTIYGYLIADLGEDTLITQESFTAAGQSPFTPANNGDAVYVTPVIQLGGGTVE